MTAIEIDVTRIQTLDEAIVTYEKIADEAKKAQDPKQKKEITKQINKLFRYILNTFVTREALRFLSEEVPSTSSIARLVGERL